MFLVVCGVFFKNILPVGFHFGLLLFSLYFKSLSCTASSLLKSSRLQLEDEDGDNIKSLFWTASSLLKSSHLQPEDEDEMTSRAYLGLLLPSIFQEPSLCFHRACLPTFQLGLFFW